MNNDENGVKPVHISFYAVFLLLILLILESWTGVIKYPTSAFLLLPNLTCFYVFSWAPFPIYFFIHLFPGYRSPVVSQLMAGVLLLSTLIYGLIGFVHLYHFYILPIGLILIIFGAHFFIISLRLYKDTENFSTSIPIWFARLLGPLAIVLTSMVYMQPWSLVFEMPNVKNKDLHGMDLSDLYLSNITFENTDLKNTDFSRTTIKNVKFKNTILDGSIFSGKKIENVDFIHSSLRNTHFSSAWFYMNNIKSTDMTKSIFNPLFVGRTYVTNSILCGVRFGDDIYMDGIYGWDDSLYDSNTVFPNNFNPQNQGLVHSSDC